MMWAVLPSRTALLPVDLRSTGHWPVAAGDPPAALRAPGTRHLVRTVSLPKLGGKLPTRTAKLAVPPGFKRIIRLNLGCFRVGVCGIRRGVSEVTRILDRAGQGDPKAAEELLPLIYEQLRRLAAHKMAGEAAGHTLQPTALVHEAWLRLSQESHSGWKNREQFYAVAAEVMRRILVDRARRRRSQKHGGHLERVELEAIEVPGSGDDETLLRVHDALERLAVEDPEKAEVVKLRFFVGLEAAETAAILKVSEKTVQRHWAFAKAWLYRAMRDGS